MSCVVICFVAGPRVVDAIVVLTCSHWLVDELLESLYIDGGKIHLFKGQWCWSERATSPAPQSVFLSTQ